MVRHGVLLIAVAIAGFCAMVIFNASMLHVWRPLYAPLPVNGTRFTTGTFVLEPGYNYGLTVSLNPDRSLPYEDCLLGAGIWDTDCKGDPSALDLLWTMRDDRGGIVASGSWPQANYGEFVGSGNYQAAIIAHVVVHRRTLATLEFRFRRDAAPLASLKPRIAMVAGNPGGSTMVAESLIGLLLAALGGLGLVIVASFMGSRYLRYRSRPEIV